jgi:hypothetical protein
MNNNSSTDGLLYVPMLSANKATPDPTMHDHEGLSGVGGNNMMIINKSAKKKILAKKTTPKSNLNIQPSNSQ